MVFTDEELKQRIGAPFSEDLKFFFGADQKAGKLFFDKVSEYWFEGMEEKWKKLFREQKRCWIV